MMTDATVEIVGDESQQQETHGRMTNVVAFELPITDSAINLLLEAETEPDMGTWFKPLPMTAVEAPVAETIQEELGDTPFAIYSGDVGRGASGYGAVLEIANFIATYGGAVAVLAEGAKVVVRLYKKLHERLGHRPLISLGTACYLAAADLSERFPNGDFRLHGFGDTRKQSPDSSYTGFDCFYVVFERDSELFFYAVDARGEVKYLSNMQVRLSY
jgi:hypothetical protein